MAGYGGKQDACGPHYAEKAIYEFTQRLSQLPHLLKDPTLHPAIKGEDAPCNDRVFEKGRLASLANLTTARPAAESSKGSSSSEREASALVEEPLAPGLLGGHFGAWRLVRRLGQGSQGRVYVGRDGTADFAVKVTQLNKKHLVDRFHREVEIMKLLAHPCVVRLLSVHLESQWAGLVMDLAEGDLLQAVAGSEQRRLKEVEARHVVKQLVEGMEHMHSRHIIHRDLKLENILIYSKQELQPHKFYEVRITDFGSSCISEKGSSYAKGAVGTPPYMAPELLHGGHHDVAVDFWSLGVALFVMLNGYFPWRDTASSSWTFPDNEAFHHLSAEAKDLICRLLRFGPSERLSNCGAHAWTMG